MEQIPPQGSKTNLSEKLRQIAQRAQNMSEATLRHEFVQGLREFVLSATGYDPLPQLEERIALPTEIGVVLHVCFDARLSCLVCEIKTPDVALNIAVEQCRRYIEGYRQQGIVSCGIAHNGCQILRLIDFSLYEPLLFFEATNYPLIFAVRKERPDVKQRTKVTLVNLVSRCLTYDLLQSELPLFDDAPKALG